MLKLGISDIRRRSYPIFNNAGFIKRAFLFGSYARGEEKDDSDLDFLVELSTDVGLEFFGLCDRLQDEFHVKVDVITEDEAERIMGTRPKNEGILIYER